MLVVHKSRTIDIVHFTLGGVGVQTCTLNERILASILAKMSGRREVRPSKRVCRSLFGRPDPEEVRRDLDLCLKSMQEEQCHKYNFDFENDLPLDSPDSRYRWEISEDSPAFYREKVYTTNSVELCAKTQTLTLEKNNNNNNIEDVPVESESDRSPGVKRNHQSHITGKLVKF